MKTAKETAQDADFNVVCVARLFLGGHVPRGALQNALDKHDAAYSAWEKEIDGAKARQRKRQVRACLHT